MIAYVVVWMSRTMPAAAFWYYRTRTEADQVARQLQQTCKVKVREVEVPEGFDRWG